MKKSSIVCALALLALPTFVACSQKKGGMSAIEQPQTAEVAPMPEVQPSENEEVGILPPVAEEPEEGVPPLTEEVETVLPKAPVSAQYLKIKTGDLNVRAGAGTAYASLGKVEKNILMAYRGKVGSWYQTYYMGKAAFVHADYAEVVSLEKTDDAIEEVIEEGLKYLGTPYVYGATRFHDGKGNLLKGFSSKQFDCSSLMQYIFYQGAGVLLNVTTRTQVSQGRAVTDELKRGDLMFFTNASRKNNTGLERVGHVALYLGDNYILHTASDYAKIEQISQTRWGYFLSARRML